MMEFSPTEGGGTAITWRIRIEDRRPEATAKFVQETSNIRIGFPLAGPQMIMHAVTEDLGAFGLNQAD